MVVQVVINERGDEEVAVVVAPVHAQIDVVMVLLAGIRQRFRVQLLLQGIGGPWSINRGKRSSAPGINRVASHSSMALSDQVTGKGFLAPGQAIGLAMGANADTDL